MKKRRSDSTPRFRPNPLLFALATIVLFSYAASSYAYLDPGTGSILLQGLIASIAAALAVGGIYWERAKLFFSSMFSSAKADTTELEQDE